MFRIFTSVIPKTIFTWFEVMSGGLSIPVGLWALLSQASNGKAFAVLAFIGLIFAAISLAIRLHAMEKRPLTRLEIRERLSEFHKDGGRIYNRFDAVFEKPEHPDWNAVLKSSTEWMERLRNFSMRYLSIPEYDSVWKGQEIPAVKNNDSHAVQVLRGPFAVVWTRLDKLRNSIS